MEYDAFLVKLLGRADSAGPFHKKDNGEEFVKNVRR